MSSPAKRYSDAAPEPAPVVLLASPQRRGDLQARLREKLPHLADRVHGDPDELIGHVFGTRQYGKDYIAEHPEIDPAERVLIDCMWVEIASSPPLSELLRAWPRAEFFNCNEDVFETVVYLKKKIKERGDGTL